MFLKEPVCGGIVAASHSAGSLPGAGTRYQQAVPIRKYRLQAACRDSTLSLYKKHPEKEGGSGEDKIVTK